MIKIYTLSNGEQIIGKESERAPDRLHTNIHNPFYIMEAHDEYGNSGMKLINVCTFSETQYITVSKQHVIFSMDANKSMIKYYEKLLEISKKTDTYRIIEDSIKEMEEMEHKMQDNLYKRLVRGSTIN